MKLHNKTIIFCLGLVLLSCVSKSTSKPTLSTAKIDSKNTNIIEVKPKKENFVLNDENAIPFFFKYAKQNPQKRVKIKTDYGNFVIELSEKTPYHRANFIYLTKANYFDGTFFHRVVSDFIIQGGNSDSYEISKRRRNIGRYLLPPDTKKGFKHHRGIVSIPSSDIENPYKLASPYEFFIVQSKNGAYHLDKNFTPFGKVIKGMEVVDIISNLETDRREWPHENVKIEIEIIN